MTSDCCFTTSLTLHLIYITDIWIKRADYFNETLKAYKFRCVIFIRYFQDARDDLYSHSQEYEQLRELGRQIMNSDHQRGSSVQGHLSEISKAWEHLTNLLGQKHQQYSGTANLWQQYVDAKQNVGRVMESVTPLVKQDITCKSQPEVKKALDQHKASHYYFQPY